MTCHPEAFTSTSCSSVKWVLLKPTLGVLIFFREQNCDFMKIVHLIFCLCDFHFETFLSLFAFSDSKDAWVANFWEH